MIYLDNAATTPVSSAVREAMLPYLHDVYGNPSSIHAAGRQARQAMDGARRTIAAWIGCSPRQLIFTSGGTEADASALMGAFFARRETHPHLVVSAIEHHAVLHTVEFLATLGAQVTYVPVDETGVVKPDDVVAAVREDTCVVSIMAVNNELGTIEPISEIASRVKASHPQVLVHSDMVQALPFMPAPLKNASDVDLAVFSAHKIHGPKGVGLLYVRPNVPWVPLMYGGQQEAKRRGGTENLAGIVGFGTAVHELQAHFDNHVRHLYQLRDTFYTYVRQHVNTVCLSPESGAPTILNLAFPGVRNDTLLMRLDIQGVAASAGSACTAGSLEPSHVIEACGYVGHLNEAVRFSFGVQNTIEEVQQAARQVVDTVQTLLGLMQ